MRASYNSRHFSAYKATAAVAVRWCARSYSYASLGKAIRVRGGSGGRNSNTIGGSRVPPVVDLRRAPRGRAGSSEITASKGPGGRGTCSPSSVPARNKQKLDMLQV